MTATPIFLAVPDLPHEAELVERFAQWYREYHGL